MNFEQYKNNLKQLGYEFVKIKNGIISFSRWNNTKNVKEYLYCIEDVCWLCGETMFRRRNNKTFNHNNCNE